jgi:hypothetical protein
MYVNVLKDMKIVKASNGAAAGTTLQTSSTIDMTGYNSILWLVDVGTVTSGAVMQLTAQDGAAANGSDAANITTPTGPQGGATSTVQTAALTDAGTNSNKTFLLDVQKPLKRYQTATFSRTTQNVVVNTIIAILYNADGPKPITVDTSVAASAEFECGT